MHHMLCLGLMWNLLSLPTSESQGTPVALVFFIIVLLCVTAIVIFVVYKKTRHRYFSTVRYRRNYDEADSASMIAESD